MAKRGRKRSHHETADGRIIPDFFQRSDGRWATSLDKNKTWPASLTEIQAEREFLGWQARREGAQIAVKKGAYPYSDENGITTALRSRDIEVTVDEDGHIEVADLVASDAFWTAMGDLIRDNPMLAARKTGIKELAYLQDLKKPAKPLPLSEVGERYYGKPKRHESNPDRIIGFEGGKVFDDPNEERRSFSVWQEFVKGVEPATTVEEVEPDHLRAYERTIRSMTHTDRKTKRKRRLGERTISNRFNKVGSVLQEAWILCKGNRPAIQELQVEFRNVCKNKHNKEGATDPIKVGDFQTLYRASNIKWRAILLCMLNFAMHPGEAIEILKGHFDFRNKTFDNRRKKTGEYRRVAIVWQETIDAIKAYQKTQADQEAYQATDFLFLTDRGNPYAKRGPTDYYRETLKSRAERLSGFKLACTLDHIRDGAQNAADDGGADPFHTEMLMGHALPGSTGSYKLRTPSKTAKSVACIHEHYEIAELVRETATQDR